MTTVRDGGDPSAPPTRLGASKRVRVVEYRGGALTARPDRLATEEPLEVRIEHPGASSLRLTTTMRTPGHDFELALGLLHSEGLVKTTDQLRSIAYCTDDDLTAEERYNVVTVRLSEAPQVPPRERQGWTSSACGVCGSESIERVVSLSRLRGQPIDREPILVADLVTMPETLRKRQRTFDRTGGLHAAGLFAGSDALVVREDIGRHNAVDKVIGASLLDPAVSGPTLCVSGRIGFEIVQKAAVAGIGLIAAVGAPSSLAVELASDAAICLVGFLRTDRFVVYTAPDRLVA